MYQFRRRSLEARLIVTVGYGFGDPHINGIVGQALGSKDDIRLFCVGLDVREDQVIASLSSQLPNVSFHNKIGVKADNAKTFFEKDLKRQTFEGLFPQSTKEAPF